MRRLAGWWRAGDPAQEVMGRPAVIVVVAYLQLPAAVQLLTPLSPSLVIDAAGPRALSYTWAGCVVAAGLLMIASWWRGRGHPPVSGSDRAQLVDTIDAAEDRRVLEVAAAALVAVLSLIYIAAAIETTDLVLSLTLSAVLGALATNLAGRSILLLRQVAALRRIRKELLT